MENTYKITEHMTRWKKREIAEVLFDMWKKGVDA